MVNLLLLLACGAGGFDLTLASALQVVAVETQPAEARPGERVAVTVHVANPDALEVEVMFWTCLYVDGGCVEVLLASEVEEWVTIGVLVDGEVGTVREIPREVDAYLGEGLDSVPVQVHALACAVGRCPIFADIRAAMDEVGIPEATAQELAHPAEWLAALPMEVVALGSRGYPVTARDATGRNENPELEARFSEAVDDPMRLPRDTEVDLAFWAADPNGETVYAWPLTTAGSFDERKVKVEDEQARLWLRTPDEATAGTVWVVIDDRDGGIAVWHRDFEVE